MYINGKKVKNFVPKKITVFNPPKKMLVSDYENIDCEIVRDVFLVDCTGEAIARADQNSQRLYHWNYCSKIPEPLDLC